MKQFWQIAVAFLITGIAVAPSYTQSKRLDVSDHISFTVDVKTEDPFAPANQAGLKEVPKIKARRGQVIQVVITGTPEAGWHTYPVTKRTSRQVAAQLTQLTVKTPATLIPLWPIRETEPELIDYGTEGKLFELGHRFSWSQDILVLSEAKPGPVAIAIDIKGLVCKGRCDEMVLTLKATIQISDEEPVALTEALAKRQQEKKPEAEVVQVPDVVALPNKGEENRASRLPGINGSHEDYKARMQEILDQLNRRALGDGGAASSDSDLVGFILAGMFWGFISLITPCVFPMIPITVSFFLKQSEKEHHRPVTMALVYCGTIVVVLTLAAALLLKAFTWLSINPIMNYAIGGLFIFFALSLFGMYDIELPSGLARFTSAREGKGGYEGTIFMALTFTIISFACVAPFLGGFGGTAAGTERPFWHTLLGGLAFSITFASPFFFLALFPTLLRKMPKSGSWLNTVKVVMGFLELAAAFKFFRAAELVSSNSPTLFTFDFVLGLYVALSLLCGLYLLGLFRLPHDEPREHLGVPRMMFALLFITLGFYLMPALFKFNAHGDQQRPAGSLYAWVESFLLPETRFSEEEPKTGNLDAAIAEARSHLIKTGQPKRIFLDFTGFTCTNCSINERSVFTKPEFRKLLQNYLIVQLYTDKVPNEFYAPDLRAQFGTSVARQTKDADEVNRDFQSKAFNDIKLPLYAILEPLANRRIDVLGVYDEGRIINETAFANFLRNPGGDGMAARAQAK